MPLLSLIKSDSFLLSITSFVFVSAPKSVCIEHSRSLSRSFCLALEDKID